MKVALVHDYLSEFGGAERVLKVLSEIYPDAPIYTAFCQKGSTAYKYFADKKIVESKLAPILKYKKLYSPLRFLAPLIWNEFNFDSYDLVISSASWYITKGLKANPKTTKHICYLHTPPRFLYGYKTAIEWQRYFLIRIYAKMVNSYLKKYDFKSAQKPDLILVNSENVRKRCKRIYKREAEIVYPPIEVKEIIDKTKNLKKEDYYLIVSRVVGAKGIDMAMKVFADTKYKLKIVGETAGLAWEEKKLEKLKKENIEFLGRVSDDKLWEIYGKAKGFLALSFDEDFGMTLVESQAAGTPVLAYWGGGYKETVIKNITGMFFYEYSEESLKKALVKFNKKQFKRKDLQINATKFSKENFVKKIKNTVVNVLE